MIPAQDVIITIQAMRFQELNGYGCSDYLNVLPELEHGSPIEGHFISGDGEVLAVDTDCRSQMVKWCYQIVDFCKFNRETAAMAISAFDRYLCTFQGREALHDTATFQLAAMAALYSSVKIHEPEIMGVDLVAQLSRGVYTVEQIEEMECNILRSVEWRVNSPTAMSFIRQFIELIPKTMVSPDLLEAAHDLSKFQTELAVGDYSFVTVPASTIAYSSLVNAFDCLSLDATIQERFCTIAAEATQIDRTDRCTQQIRDYLYEAITKSANGEGSDFDAKSEGKARWNKTESRFAVEASPSSVCT